MNISQPVLATASSISFQSLSSSDITSISVKQVVNPVMFDNLNRPQSGSLYDPAFGPLGKGDVCQTCRLSSFDCPGHFGHIALPIPVFHPLYMTQAYQLLRGTCSYCHQFLIAETTVIKFVAKLRLLENGLVVQADLIDDLAPPTKPLKSAKKGKTKKKKDEEETLSDQEIGGESVEETTDEYKQRLEMWVEYCLNEQRKAEGRSSAGRDGYKNSGNGFDRRKRLIQEFLKALPRKTCTRCGAGAHRLRKEGHTKIIEYSLVGKQKAFHQAAGIRRLDVLALEEINQNGTSTPKKSSRKGKEKKNEDTMDVDSAESDEDEEENSDEDSGVEDSDLSEKEEEQRKWRKDEDEGVNGYGEDEEMEIQSDDDSDAVAEKQAKGGKKKRSPQTERIITPKEVRAHLRLLFQNESEITTLLYAPHGPLSLSSASSSTSPRKPSASPDIFFTSVISVPPSRFRPAATMGDQVFENPQNALLNGILRQTFVVRDLSESLRNADVVAEGEEKPKVDKGRVYVQLLESLIGLQVAVNSMMDNGKNPMLVKGGKEPPQGVKQLLEKKEGLFRKNMMGKRVNYAARSVISPDVNIETNEIGVPPVFARKLTFPEPVTPHNIQELRAAVINGPDIHPGASFIQMEDGNLISLNGLSVEDRTAHANKLLAPESTTSGGGRLDRPDVGLPQTKTPQINRKVYRHLQDGDIVILNRQPTLHKPSMMCHRVRVLKGEKTIRMHYANCNSYNADFDGDEMNMHFPQSLIAQAEARLIANTDNQYLVPTSGNPLRGLIQDHVVSGVWLTNKDTFFTREEYYQLIYGALRPENDYTGGGSVLTVDPAIWKPVPLWTGKQVISTLLKNITPPSASGLNFSCKAKVPGSAWGIHTSEETVLVVDGDLLTGIIDKAQIGASPYGLVHSVHEVYGAEIAGKLLSILSRLLTKFLQSRAFTCRMDDLILTAKGNANRREMLQVVNQKGLDAALDYVGLGGADKTLPETADDLRARLEEILRDDYKLSGLDASVEGETNQVTTQLIKTCLPHGLVKPFPHNNMQTMTVSGAKGSNVNASQISCLLGQQSLEGRRVPTMVSGKTLPSFKAFETAPRAGGFVAGRFLTGIRPQEYYFHCMAGREGLIDTAVKTSRSGYLQRCLIKHLEGLRVHYDHTVRNSDSSILQFHYGEDSLDVTKQKHLLQFEFAVKNLGSLLDRYQPQRLLETVNDIGHHPSTKAIRNPDTHPPVLSELSPSTNLGSVSEMYAERIEQYIDRNPDRLIKPRKEKDDKVEKKEKPEKEWPAFVDKSKLIKQKYFRTLMHIRYMRSLVEPGEAVGLMASQGVGEPSTQMTLNTFHFAGHGAANVTLGIPRLREIVMTASQNIKTPMMTLPILPSVSPESLAAFCKNNTRLTLSQIVDNVTVDERLSPKSDSNNWSRQKLYTIRLNFFPEEDYVSEYNITPERILKGIAKSFVPQLDRAILSEIKKNDKEIRAEASDVGKARSKVSNAKAARQDAAAAAEGGAGGGDDDDLDIPGEAVDDDDRDEDDAKDSRRRAKSADGSDDEGGSDEDDDAKLEAAFKDSDAESDAESEEEDEEIVAAQKSKDRTSKVKAQCRDISGHSRYVDAVRFDIDGGQWCEFDIEFSSRSFKLLLVGIVERICRIAIVHEVAKIVRCFVPPAANENAAKKREAVTEGVNLQGCWDWGHDKVDLDEIYTNDVGATLRTYGVEAARRVIIKEMSNVFGAYGIGVDYRHLTIIADYMTCEGSYKPFNRTGLSNNSSPFLKASFETTANFVAEAALYGDFDDLGTPSANIVLGKVPRSGTGVFAVCEAVEV